MELADVCSILAVNQVASLQMLFAAEATFSGARRRRHIFAPGRLPEGGASRLFSFPPQLPSARTHDIQGRRSSQK